jgi:hypothetical protein
MQHLPDFTESRFLDPFDLPPDIACRMGERSDHTAAGPQLLPTNSSPEIDNREMRGQPITGSQFPSRKPA